MLPPNSYHQVLRTSRRALQSADRRSVSDDCSSCSRSNILARTLSATATLWFCCEKMYSNSFTHAVMMPCAVRCGCIGSSSARIMARYQPVHLLLSGDARCGALPCRPELSACVINSAMSHRRLADSEAVAFHTRVPINRYLGTRYYSKYLRLPGYYSCKIVPG